MSERKAHNSQVAHPFSGDKAKGIIRERSEGERLWSEVGGLSSRPVVKKLLEHWLACTGYRVIVRKVGRQEVLGSAK